MALPEVYFIAADIGTVFDAPFGDRQQLLEEYRFLADCFLEAYHLSRTKETFRKYISTLPLFLSEEDYQKQLEELKADPYLVQKIQEYNAKMCTSEEYLEEKERMHRRDRSEVVKDLKEQYCRSTKI